MNKILKWILINFGVLVLIKTLKGYCCHSTSKRTESADQQQTDEPQP
ncbi:MAG: hypothetical protein RBT65_09295 [Methanolobus sp.]|nr:hypothetical protein [Methanolobus sp.]